ncbi:hypothetical protein [Timonella senegalensis]|uniref:hypothetical protein n=1 Tax=Timonella senegalensis TaxID=1465825 RepID=UPI002FDCCC97
MTSPNNSYQQPPRPQRAEQAGLAGWFSNRDNVIITALAAVDAALIALVFAIGASSFGWFSSPDAKAETPITQGQTSDDTGTDAGTEEGAGQPTDNESTDSNEDVQPAKFATPTGNIACEIGPDGASCTIAQLAKKPKPNKNDCKGYVGYEVRLDSAGVTLPCLAKEDIPGSAGSGLDVLDYGSSQNFNNFSCESTRTGVKCTDTGSGRGFNVARAGITTF